MLGQILAGAIGGGAHAAQQNAQGTIKEKRERALMKLEQDARAAQSEREIEARSKLTDKELKARAELTQKELDARREEGRLDRSSRQSIAGMQAAASAERAAARADQEELGYVAEEVSSIREALTGENSYELTGSQRAALQERLDGLLKRQSMLEQRVFPMASGGLLEGGPGQGGQGGSGSGGSAGQGSGATGTWSTTPDAAGKGEPPKTQTSGSGGGSGSSGSGANSRADEIANQYGF